MDAEGNEAKKLAGVHLSPISSIEENCKNSLSFRRDGDCPIGHGAALIIQYSVFLTASVHRVEQATASGATLHCPGLAILATDG